MEHDKDDDKIYKLKQMQKKSTNDEVKRNTAMFDQIVKSSKATMQYMVPPKK
ncbi:MAG: hypothetical protein JEZ08_08265 [Clostridiales bacterium]|nr:hypothetical protein [Clostridiales bacterium]